MSEATRYIFEIMTTECIKRLEAEVARLRGRIEKLEKKPKKGSAA